MVGIESCCLGDSNAKTCTSVHCRNSSISSGVRGGTRSARVEDLLFVETRLWWWIFDWFSRREKVRPRKRSAPISEFFFCNSKPTFMLLLNLFYHVKPSSHHCSSRVFYSYVWNILDKIQIFWPRICMSKSCLGLWRNEFRNDVTDPNVNQLMPLKHILVFPTLVSEIHTFRGIFIQNSNYNFHFCIAIPSFCRALYTYVEGVLLTSSHIHSFFFYFFFSKAIEITTKRNDVLTVLDFKWQWGRTARKVSLCFRPP